MARAETAARPPQRQRRVGQLTVSLTVALGVVGFAVATQWRGEAPRVDFTSSAQQALAAQVLELEQEQEELGAQIAEHEARIAQLQQSGGQSRAGLDQLNERLTEARLAAGLTALRGPGLVVEIADSNRVLPDDADLADYIVQVDDLRDIVTALWSSGAEAIAINEERLVSTTSIYAVGSSILVNSAHLPPPYAIHAIGPDDLEQRFYSNPAFAGRVQRRVDIFGLEFATRSAPELVLPAFDGSTRLRWAVAEGEEPT